VLITAKSSRDAVIVGVANTINTQAQIDRMPHDRKGALGPEFNRLRRDPAASHRPSSQMPTVRAAAIVRATPNACAM
jgi:hypothetical protein